MSNIENNAGVIATIRRHAEAHRALAGSDAYSEQEAPRLEAALAAVERLVERGRALQRRAGRAEWSLFAEALANVADESVEPAPAAAVNDRELAFALGDAARVAYLEHGRDSWVTIGRAIVAELRRVEGGAA